MTNINWDNIKFRASSWGNLLAESKTKGELIGATCAKELIKIYNQVVYGRKKDITTRQMDKGILAEGDSINLFSRVEGKLFFKNEEKLENEWFCGHPDVFVGDNIQNATEIWDIKSSYELDSFMPKLIESIDKGYEAQLNVYFDLCGAQEGGIAYCLVDCPPQVLEGEKYALLRRMNVVSELSPEYLEAEVEMTHLLTFPDIDYRERVIPIKVQRNDELIEKMKAKVPILRQWLHDFHTKHINLYPKQ